MMSAETYNILDRLSGAVRFAAEITCSPTDLPSVKLGLAVKVAVKEKSDLRGADLRGAYLSGADLSRADLRGAYLSGADLRGADLSGADLRGADLRGAYLSGEKIARLLARATRLIESYEFLAFELESGGYKILAGCRWFSDAEFRAHVKAEYPGSDKATETLAILDFLKSRAKALGVSLKAPKLIAVAS